MSTPEEKVVQYLGEAHASEVCLTRVLEAQIAMTPRGSFRDLLEGHLTETRDHAERLRRRIEQIAGKSGFNPLSLAISVAETVIGQVIAVGKTPIDLIRGSGGEEKLLKNAKDDCAAESLEIATYIALEALARSAGDAKTAELAGSILADEERMLDGLRAELPRLVEGWRQPRPRWWPTRGRPSPPTTHRGPRASRGRVTTARRPARSPRPSTGPRTPTWGRRSGRTSRRTRAGRQ